MNEIFNNREIAIGIWLTISLILVSQIPELRSSLNGVVTALMQKAIITFFVFMGIHVALSIYFLIEIKHWNSGQLKSTIIWFIFVVAISFFHVNKISEENN